jgi:hypothetical protein
VLPASPDCWLGLPRSSLPFVQGGALNRGLKRFFSIYRPSCHIEVYIRPEKNCFVWAGPLANHPFNFNFIFLGNGLTAAMERAACFADLYRRYPAIFRSDGWTWGRHISVGRSLAFLPPNAAG